jgi:hypothetical protein
MAMKETLRSLTAYFLVVGTIAIAITIRDATRLDQMKGLTGGQTFAVYFGIALTLVLGAAYLFAGVSLKRALTSGAGWIKTLVLLSGVAVIIDTAIAVSMIGDLPGVRTAAIIRCVIGILIAFYLHTNITRLARETNQGPTIA